MSESRLQDTLVQYQKHLGKCDLSQVTIKGYVGDIKHFASWLSDTRRTSLLCATGEDIRDYCSELALARGYPPATVNRRLQSIRKFYGYALERGLVEENPSLGIKLLPQPRSQVARGLDESEIEGLLDAVQQGPPRLVKRDYAIIQLMLQTGIRVGELTRLQLSDLSLSEDKGVLKIQGRGGCQDREVPLNNSVRKAIGAYLEERPMTSSDHLFLSTKGDPLSVRSVQRLVNTYAGVASLEKVSTHTLRQTCGQYMLRDTGDLALVAKLLGHKRLETAIKYVLPPQEDLTEVAEKSSLNIY
jgi:site-specific recombinase XerD